LLTYIVACIKTKRVGKDLIDRVQDARRFILYGQSGIMDWPLQVYAGALIFSPEKSITRLQYQAEEPRWINHKPMVGYHWSPCLQALEHGSPVESVCFSPNSQLVASSCSTGSVKVWDSNSGQCLSNFDVKETWIFAISYLSNSKLLALTSPGKVWDITERLCISNLGSCDNEVSCGAFFPRPDTIVTGSRYGTIKFWSSGNGEFLRKLEGHSDRITNFAFSPDIKCLASGSRDRTIKIWNIDSGKCLHTIDAHEDMVNSLAFSSDFKLFSSCSLTLDGGIKLWETQNWNCITTLHGHTSWVESLEFSHDSKLLVSGSEDHSIKLWDSYSGECLQTFFGHQFAVSSVVFSHDSQILASASADGTVRIWDAKDRQQPRQIDSHNCESELYFSHDSRLLASVAVVEDGSPCEIKIWNAQNGQCIRTLKGSRGRTYSLMFSNNLSLLAEGSSDNTVRVWDIKSAKCMQTFIGTYYVDTFFSENPSLKIFNGTVVSDSFSLYGPNSLTHYGSLQGQSGSIRRFSRFITWHSRCLLWLPPEYRNGPLVGSGDSVSTDSTLCISCSSGRVLLFIFDPAMLLDTLPDVEPVTWFDFI
jgi:WD40 repeat protein